MKFTKFIALYLLLIAGVIGGSAGMQYYQNSRDPEKMCSDAEDTLAELEDRYYHPLYMLNEGELKRYIEARPIAAACRVDRSILTEALQ